MRACFKRTFLPCTGMRRRLLRDHAILHHYKTLLLSIGSPRLKLHVALPEDCCRSSLLWCNGNTLCGVLSHMTSLMGKKQCYEILILQCVFDKLSACMHRTMVLRHLLLLNWRFLTRYQPAFTGSCSSVCWWCGTLPCWHWMSASIVLTGRLSIVQPDREGPIAFHGIEPRVP